jgi:hypothetical protein
MNATARKLSELDEALDYFARIYMNTGCEWDEACDHAEFMAQKFRFDTDSHEPHSDSVVASRLYGEACRYANM